MYWYNSRPLYLPARWFKIYDEKIFNLLAALFNVHFYLRSLNPQRTQQWSSGLPTKDETSETTGRNFTVCFLVYIIIYLKEKISSTMISSNSQSFRSSSQYHPLWVIKCTFIIKWVLFTLHNYSDSCSLDFLKLFFNSKSRLPISEFYGYNCIFSGC